MPMNGRSIRCQKPRAIRCGSCYQLDRQSHHARGDTPGLHDCHCLIRSQRRRPAAIDIGLQRSLPAPRRCCGRQAREVGPLQHQVGQRPPHRIVGDRNGDPRSSPPQRKQPCGTNTGWRLPMRGGVRPVADCSISAGATRGSMHSTCDRSMFWPCAGRLLVQQRDHQRGGGVEAADRIAIGGLVHGRRIVRKAGDRSASPDACSSVEP